MNNLISRINRMLPMFVNMILLLFVIVQASSGIFDTDIWLHLKTGKLIFNNLNVPSFDPYSFTTGAKHWINHEWLFQLSTYILYSFSGVNGLVFLQTLLIVFAFFVLFLFTFKDNRFVIITSVLALLTIYACKTRFNLRPDTLSLILFTIFLYHLKFLRKSKLIYYLVFCQLIWVNCHGYFFLGPFLVLVFILAELIRRRFKTILPGEWANAGAMDEVSFKRLIKLFVMLLFVSILNPQFLNGALYPVYILKDLLSGNANYAFKHVEELATAFHIKSDVFVGNLQLNILVLLAALSLIANWRKMDIAYLLLFIFFVPFGFSTLRNISFLAFISFIIIVSRLDLMNDAVMTKVKIDIPSANSATVVNIILVGLLTWFLAGIGYESMLRRYYDFDKYEMKSSLSGTIDYRYPKKGVEFLVKNDLPKNIFNDFNSGAYLIFHAWPKYKVFVDGRTELYSNNFFETYFKIMRGEKKAFDSEVEKFNINTVFLNNATAVISRDIFKMLYENPKWQLVFFDDSSVIFVRNTIQNENLIRRFAINLKQWKAPKVDLQRLTLTNLTPDTYIDRLRLLDFLGLDEAIISEANEALKIQPNSSLAHFYLGKVYFRQNKYLDALEHLRIAFVSGYKKKDIKVLLAKTFLKLGDKERAKNIYLQLLKENPKDIEAKEVIPNTSNSKTKKSK